MSKYKTDLPPPTVPPCMLFCDGVIVEQGSGKTTLVGTYSGIAAPSFPSPPRDIHVYVRLTSYVGDVPVRLVCLRTDGIEPQEIYSTVHKVHFRDKLFVEQVHIIWTQFQFPAPGEYAFQLWSKDRCIAERRLHARVKGEGR